MASYMYSYTVSHAGLGKFRVVTGTSEYEVRMEAEELKAKWEEQYRKQQAREKHANDIEDLINEAERQNEEARESAGSGEHSCEFNRTGRVFLR